MNENDNPTCVVCSASILEGGRYCEICANSMLLSLGIFMPESIRFAEVKLMGNQRREAQEGMTTNTQIMIAIERAMLEINSLKIAVTQLAADVNRLEVEQCKITESYITKEIYWRNKFNEEERERERIITINTP